MMIIITKIMIIILIINNNDKKKYNIYVNFFSHMCAFPFFDLVSSYHLVKFDVLLNHNDNTAHTHTLLL